ncbi:MAG: lactate utilization protein [Nanoarchaeota archaeon]|nr:lactate utilization protein [Nanoarchaeota archaeon]
MDIQKTLSNLKKNNIVSHFAKNKIEAKKIALSLIPQNSTIGFGGSMTVEETGLKGALLEAEEKGRFILFDSYKPGFSREESIVMRHKGMQADVFVTGTNAVTENGELVNMDGYGNRVSAMICGPKKVIIITGKNKIVASVDDGLERIKAIAGPLNAKRLNKNTPCVKTGRCMDCESPERICNATAVIHKGRGKDRMQVIIVDEELGL